VPPPYRSSKVIVLKLFLDMVPSSSEDVTCAMRGPPKRKQRVNKRDLYRTWEMTSNLRRILDPIYAILLFYGAHAKPS